MFGNDDVNNSKLKVAESNNYGLCKCFYESNPNYFRVILIRGDYLENNLHYYRPDGRYKWPLNVLVLSAYYKVYVPIWE